MIISHLGNSTSAVIHRAHLHNITEYSNQKIIRVHQNQDVNVESIIYFKINPDVDGDQMFSMLLDSTRS